MFREFLEFLLKKEDEIDFKKLQKYEDELKKEKFKRILHFADLVFKKADENKNLDYTEHPILDVIRLLGKKLQVKYLSHLLIEWEDERRLEKIDSDYILFRGDRAVNKDGLTLDKIKKKIGEVKTIDLSCDLVLPWPWEPTRLISCLGTIGKGRNQGEWKQDDNHHVELWYPMRIAWVSQGNHSIATGIIQGKGEIKTNNTYDISEVYNYVNCDGLYYTRKDNGSKISKVNDLEFAAIFEIGRKMFENKNEIVND